MQCEFVFINDSFSFSSFDHNYLPESPIRAVDKFCVQPQRASCQIPDETALVYKSPADCSKEYQKFIYDDGVLIHKCSGKYVCPRGLLEVQIFRTSVYTLAYLLFSIFGIYLCKYSFQYAIFLGLSTFVIIMSLTLVTTLVVVYVETSQYLFDWF